ncbi:hypothetical protein [Nitrososphaeria virus YSH_462411]|uniref:Uncharacterized protein n=1 Tax=Nitrososphaeria virus YSH_462411 TaxID=3071321 RepID=A0A976UAJ2_9CAUD|nr:hypothetical protein QKV92_gp68 [Yangshan Harbor Nitrososphaeria virus]UVF62340.1 hypothetical protein [Nitrososphaeria virus YSH_462411]
MCIQCAKRIHWQDYTKYKCKNCDNTSNHSNAKCWTKLGLCRTCAKKHRDENRSLYRPSYYKLCPYCRNTIQKLRYQKNRINASTNLYICVPCRKIIVYETRFQIETLNKVLLSQKILN